MESASQRVRNFASPANSADAAYFPNNPFTDFTGF